MEQHILISGPSGAGKTYIATDVAQRLGAVLLSKDRLKEAMARTLHDGTADSSLRLSGAAMDVLYNLATASATGVVMEANWRADLDVPRLSRLGRPIVEVYCHAPVTVLQERIRGRVDSGERHPVHRDVIDAETLVLAVEWAGVGSSPLELGGPLLTVDTSGETDHVETIVAWVRPAVRIL